MTFEPVEISPSILAKLRRDASEQRAVIIGSFMESTPEGLWHADRRRYEDDAERRIDRIHWDLRRDFERVITWQVIHGEGTYPPPLVREAVDGLTPEQFYNRELRRLA